MRTLILAGSFREASEYARARGLRHHRYASSAAAVETFAAQHIVELPGYVRRMDKHAINAVVRRLTARGVEHVKDEYVPEPDPIDESPLGVLGRMTLADWLMAGATPAQAAAMTPQLTAEQAAEVERVNAEKYDAIAAISDLGEDKPAAPKRKRAPRKTTPRKTSSGNAASPVAAESTDIPNVDDLFED